jgi:RHS repeat-associated protein
VTSQSNAAQQPVIGFTGLQTFAALGLDEAGIRFYDPQSQQWLQQDSILLDAGPNTREYVNDAPTNATDPSGQQASAVSGWAKQRQEQLDQLYATHDQLTRAIVRRKFAIESVPGGDPAGAAAVTKFRAIASNFP